MNRQISDENIKKMIAAFADALNFLESALSQWNNGVQLNDATKQEGETIFLELADASSLLGQAPPATDDLDKGRSEAVMAIQAAFGIPKIFEAGAEELGDAIEALHNGDSWNSVEDCANCAFYLYIDAKAKADAARFKALAQRNQL